MWCTMTSVRMSSQKQDAASVLSPPLSVVVSMQCSMKRLGISSRSMRHILNHDNVFQEMKLDSAPELPATQCRISHFLENTQCFEICYFRLKSGLNVSHVS